MVPTFTGRFRSFFSALSPSAPSSQVVTAAASTSGRPPHGRRHRRLIRVGLLHPGSRPVADGGFPHGQARPQKNNAARGGKVRLLGQSRSTTATAASSAGLVHGATPRPGRPRSAGRPAVPYRRGGGAMYGRPTGAPGEREDPAGGGRVTTAPPAPTLASANPAAGSESGRARGPGHRPPGTTRPPQPDLWIVGRRCPPPLFGREMGALSQIRAARPPSGAPAQGPPDSRRCPPYRGGPLVHGRGELCRLLPLLCPSADGRPPPPRSRGGFPLDATPAFSTCWLAAARPDLPPPPRSPLPCP